MSDENKILEFFKIIFFRYIALSTYINRTKVNLNECQNDSNSLQSNEQTTIRVKRNFLDLFKKPTFVFHLMLNCYIL